MKWYFWFGFDPELYYQWYVFGVIFLILFIGVAVIVSVINKRRNDRKVKNFWDQITGDKKNKKEE